MPYEYLYENGTDRNLIKADYLRTLNDDCLPVFAIFCDNATNCYIDLDIRLSVTNVFVFSF